MKKKKQRIEKQHRKDYSRQKKIMLSELRQTNSEGLKKESDHQRNRHDDKGCKILNWNPLAQRDGQRQYQYRKTDMPDDVFITLKQNAIHRIKKVEKQQGRKYSSIKSCRIGKIVDRFSVHIDAVNADRSSEQHRDK